MTANAEHGGTGATVWEPWTFEVGDRVLVNPSPECRAQGDDTSPLTSVGEVGHVPGEYGATGVIVGISDPAMEWMNRQGHRFCVRFDIDILVGNVWCQRGTYACVELEPLTSARQSPPRGAGDGEAEL
jgi:hypothetical protein